MTWKRKEILHRRKGASSNPSEQCDQVLLLGAKLATFGALLLLLFCLCALLLFVQILLLLEAVQKCIFLVLFGQNFWLQKTICIKSKIFYSKPQFFTMQTQAKLKMQGIMCVFERPQQVQAER
jgi:hypothetical protein